MTVLSNKDRRGNPISVGDDAEILMIPQWLTQDLDEDEVVALKRIKGTVMKVLEIDAHGYVWFGADNEGRWFCLRPDEIAVVRPK